MVAAPRWARQQEPPHPMGQYAESTVHRTPERALDPGQAGRRSSLRPWLISGGPRRDTGAQPAPFGELLAGHRGRRPALTQEMLAAPLGG